MCDIFWSSSPGVFSGYPGFLPSFIGLMVQLIRYSKNKCDFHCPLCPLPEVFTGRSVFSIPPVGACSCGTDRKRNSRQTCKIGSQAPQTQNPDTYREAKTLLHSRYNGDWKKDNGGYQAHLDPIWRLERAQQTTIFRLRTGHCGLSARLKRTGISDTSLCEC